MSFFLTVFTDLKAFLKDISEKNLKIFSTKYHMPDTAALESTAELKSLIGFPDNQSSMCLALNIDALLKDSKCLSGMDGREYVLIVDRYLPTYDRDSGYSRTLSFLEVLRDMGYNVVFFPDKSGKKGSNASEIEKIGIEVLDCNIDFEEYLEKFGHMFSFIILSKPEQMFKYCSLIRAYAINAFVIYDAADLHWIRLEKLASITVKKEFMEESELYKSIELFNAASSDITFTTTEVDKLILLKENPRLKVEVMPDIHDATTISKPFRERKDIIFIGDFIDSSNQDAVFYFVKKIFPKIKRKLKGVRLFVIGSEPSDALKRLNSDTVVVTGYVRDVTPYFESCRVFVSPLRYDTIGKGIIGLSMAYGLPVVTTTIGAEGLGITDGENALVSDDPKEFAKAAIRLYKDETLWIKLSKGSMEHINANYSKAASIMRIKNIFSTIKAEGPVFVEAEERS